MVMVLEVPNKSDARLLNFQNFPLILRLLNSQALHTSEQYLKHLHFYWFYEIFILASRSFRLQTLIRHFRLRKIGQKILQW